MTCEICLELLSRFLDEDLSSQEVLAMDQHLQVCDHCREVYQDLKEVQRAMNDMPDPKLPEETHRGAMAVIRRIASSRRKNRVIAWSGAAAAVLIVCAVSLPTLLGANTSNLSTHSGGAMDYAMKSEAQMAMPESMPMPTAAPATAFEEPMSDDMLYGSSRAAGEAEMYDAGVDTAFGLMPEVPQEATGDTLHGIKIERSYHLSLESKAFDSDLERVDALLASTEGYYEYRDISGMPYTEPGGYGRYASMNIRVPVERLDAFVGELRLTGRIVSYSEYANDITSQYYDTQGRLEAYQAELKQYQALLERAEVVEDILKIHDAMTSLQYQIDSLTGQIKGMDGRVSYATVSLYVREVEADMIRPVNPTLGERIKIGFYDAVNAVLAFLSGMLVFIVAKSPVWLPILIIVVIAFFAVRHIIRKKKGTSS